MGEGALDVVLPEPPVEGDGFGELRDIGGGTTGEASAAGDWGFFIHFLFWQGVFCHGVLHKSSKRPAPELTSIKP